MRIKIHSGFTLIEILVSLVLLATLLFGIDAMQILSIRDNRATYYFTVASHQIHNMHERLRALSSPAQLGTQVALWNVENNEVLPAGSGTVNRDLSHYVINIFWGDIKHTTCDNLQLGQSGCLQQKI